MKTKIILFLTCLLVPVMWVSAKNQTIKGNGNVTKKVIPITQYNTIDVAG